MIVVDATVLADFFVGTPERQAAANALLMEDSDWISVSLWRYELGNVFRSGIRARVPALDGNTGLRHLQNAESLIIETMGVLDSGQILELALQRGLTMYDASYVWAAKTRGLKLRTRDAEILKSCPDVALSMSDGSP